MRPYAPIALVVSLVVLAACGGPSVIVLRSPSGEIKECRGDTPGATMMVNNKAASDCAAGYTAAGYTRLN